MKNLKSKTKVSIYTDGACSGNPGPGGWAALILISNPRGKDKITLSGKSEYTTNNRMELLAVIESLKLMYKLNMEGSNIKIVSDSSYVVNIVNNKTLKKWSLNGWKTKQGGDVKNRELWEELLVLIKELKPIFKKVKGHSGNKFNEYVDKIAQSKSKKAKEEIESV